MELAFTLDTIQQVAEELWKTAGTANVLAFHGALGAGKTTLIRALCEAKKVEDLVSSPTFSIINEYVYTEDGKARKLFHIDLYRLRDEEEVLQAGVEDCLCSGQLCLVEWPEKAPSLFPDSTLHLYLEVINGQTRRLQIGKN